MRKTLEKEIEDIVETYLEDNSFEDLLEQFDLTPTEVFLAMYESGHIDDDLLERFRLTDNFNE